MSTLTTPWPGGHTHSSVIILQAKHNDGLLTRGHTACRLSPAACRCGVLPDNGTQRLPRHHSGPLAHQVCESSGVEHWATTMCVESL